MTKDKLLLSIFFGVGICFIIGSAIDVRVLLTFSNILLIPVLLLYYQLSSRRIFVPIAIVLLLLYVRDIFLIHGSEQDWGITWIFFLLAMFIFILCLITGFKMAKLHPVEILSFLIMYGFLAYLFMTMAEIVPQELPSREWMGYSYLLLLMLLMAGSFTAYIMKSHMASLWFMVASSAFLLSELSLYFELFILDDFSVRLLYPLFHVLAYLGFVEYGLRRRRSGALLFF